MSRVHGEARSAARGLVWMSVGHVLSFLIAGSLMLVVPRVLGAVDFGRWILYRSIIMLTGSVSGLGAVQTMARFYVECRTRGQDGEAGRIFKAIAALRLAAALVLSLAGLLIVRLQAGTGFTPAAAVCAAFSILCINQGATFLLLPYAERRRDKLAALKVFEALLVPLTVLMAYRREGFPAVPWAVAGADLVFLGIAKWVSRAHRIRAVGWPDWATWRRLLSYMGLVAVTSTTFSMYMQAIPVCMGLAGFAAQEIAFIGLGIKLTDTLLRSLMSMSSAIFPALTVALVSDGPDRARLWQGMVCRWGAVLLMAVAGAYFLLGGPGVQLVWGSAFAPAAPIIGLCLLSSIGLWLGSQFGQFALLVNRPGRYALSVILLYAGFAGAFLVPRFSVAQAMVAGSGIFAFSGYLFQRFTGTWHFREGKRLVWPALALIWAWYLGERLAGGSSRMAGVLLWLLLISAVSLWSGSIRSVEIREILGHLRPKRKPVSPPPMQRERQEGA